MIISRPLLQYRSTALPPPSSLSRGTGLTLQQQVMGKPLPPQQQQQQQPPAQQIAKPQILPPIPSADKYAWTFLYWAYTRRLNSMSIHQTISISLITSRRHIAKAEQRRDTLRVRGSIEDPRYNAKTAPKNPVWYNISSDILIILLH